MRLSVNVDHFASLRQARRSSEPEPVLAALLAEQAGADGITAHIRGDRRHINERDLMLLRKVIKTKLTVEMAATEEMNAVAVKHPPGRRLPGARAARGADHERRAGRLAGLKALAAAHQSPGQGGHPGLRLHRPGAAQIRGRPGPGRPPDRAPHGDLRQGRKTCKAREKAWTTWCGRPRKGGKRGLEVTAGHDMDYKNVGPICAIPEMTELSIGFSIVARAAIVGVSQAVREMVLLLK